MTRRHLARTALVACLLFASGNGRAEDAPAGPETFEIGLSSDSISVGTNFGGARLVVFGALDNADTRVLRQGRYDIVVVLEGPKSSVVVREKNRVFGIWINRRAEPFRDVPISYALTATRPLRDIAPTTLLRQLSLGADNLSFGQPAGTDDANRAASARALLRLKNANGLYTESVGAVEFVSPTLFRATLALPADLPVGRHVAKAFLFRQGIYLREREEDLWVLKTGFENRISNLAVRHGLFYGFAAVALAVLTGWFGRIAFKRD